MNTIQFPPSRKKKMQEREDAEFGPPTDGSIDPWDDAPQIALPAQTPISLMVLDDRVVLEFPASDREKESYQIERHTVDIAPEHLSRLATALLAARNRYWPTDYVVVDTEEAS